MTRLPALLLLVLGLAAVPASAQDALPDTAQIDTVEVIEADPERARELYDTGRDQLRASDFEAALATFDEALVYNETYAAAALGRAQALAQLRRFEDSRSAAESAIALAEASDAGAVKTAAERLRDQVAGVLEQMAERQAEADAANAANSMAQKVQQAVEMLQAEPVAEAAAIDAYALLEQARMEGYDADRVAYFYAKALNAMSRGADAVPYAVTAVAASEGQADRSAYYVELGRAHLGAGNADEARAAFEAINEGEAWHSWKAHYIGQVDAMAAGSN